MVDFARVLSGYDIEVQVGEGFFLQALKSVFESGTIETTYQVSGGTVTIDPPSAVSLLFASRNFTEFDDNGQAVSVSKEVDLEITIPAHLQFGGTSTDLSPRISILLEQDEKTDERTGLVNEIQLVPRYQGLDRETRDLVLLFASPQQLEEIEANLKVISEIRMTDQLIPGALHKMAVRRLPAAQGFQACLALYANLDLKTGPLNENVSSSGPDGIPLVITRVLPPKPPEEAEDRGDESLGVNFLTFADHVAFAAPAAIYDRLAVDRMHIYTKEFDDGNFSRPLYQPSMNPFEGEGQRIGSYKSLRLSATGNKHNDFGALKVKARVYVSEANTDATQDIIFHPKRKDDGDLWWDVDVKEPEAETSFFYMLLALISVGLAFPVFAGFGLGIAAITVAGVLTGIGSTLIKTFTEKYEDESQRNLQRMLDRQKDGMLSFLGMIPTRVTVVRRREDPFYYRHYQVATNFKIRIRDAGVSFFGTSRTAQESRPIDRVKLVGRSRQGEPMGELRSIHYRVPNWREIINANTVRRTDPRRKPDVYAITPEDARRRVERNELKLATIINPDRVRVRSGRISEIFFDEGIALVPAEAARLHLWRVLSVSRLRLIRARGGIRYYRTKPDVFKHNNLTEWPAYVCYRSRKLGLELKSKREDYADYLAEDMTDELWAFVPSNDTESIGVKMVHLVSGLYLLRRMVQDIVSGDDVSVLTPAILSSANVWSNKSPSEVTASQVVTLMEHEGEALEELVHSLSERILERSTTTALHEDTVSLFEFIQDVVVDGLREQFAAFKNIRVP